MLVLRTAQIQALSGPVQAAFEQEMFDHLLKFSPRHCAVIKEAGIREVVRGGMERAFSFGFTNRGPVRLFIELMFMFGSDFAIDPQHAWAAPSLQVSEPDDQMYRAELLDEAAGRYLGMVSGPGHRYAIAALHRARQEIDERGPRPYETGDFVPAILTLLRDVYPEKVNYLKEQGMQTVVTLGLALAAVHGVKGSRGHALFVFLVFVLGHGFTNDPLYPWIRSALADPRISDPEARATRVESRATVYLDHVVAYVRKL